MSVISSRSEVHASPFTGSRLRRLPVPVALLAGAALLVFGLRVGADHGRAWLAARNAPPAAAQSSMPVSGQIEEHWGIRFTIVQLLADNGLVELRYQVLDNDKANRLHADSNSVADIPSVRVEGSGATVRPNSLLFHIHHEWDQGSEGRSYSIVYGNAGGAIHPNDRVTILMADGLQLWHVPVFG